MQFEAMLFKGVSKRIHLIFSELNKLGDEPMVNNSELIKHGIYPL